MDFYKNDSSQNETAVLSKSFMARVAEQAQNYEDMFSFIKEMLSVKGDADFTIEERNLLSTAFKNSIQGDRRSMRVIEAVGGNKNFEKYHSHIKLFKKKIEKNITNQCVQIIKICTNDCLPLAANTESKAFFLKMIADYHRYQAEHSSMETN